MAVFNGLEMEKHIFLNDLNTGYLILLERVLNIRQTVSGLDFFSLLPNCGCDYTVDLNSRNWEFVSLSYDIIPEQLRHY